ncbi:hypothetical protein Mapa_003907 [Marchantia paleacea]|nr:hypothetical protein Mapa_003907 [Marchantia paleacea]
MSLDLVALVVISHLLPQFVISSSSLDYSPALCALFFSTCLSQRSNALLLSCAEAKPNLRKHKALLLHKTLIPEELKGEIGGPGLKAKTMAPPLLMSGRTVVVKQPRNPYYIYIGIVQRVTNGRACIIFEGGNWDKFVTFKITDL